MLPVADAPEGDGAVPRRVAADTVARVAREARDELQRRVVLVDGRLVLLPQELQVARQVVGARAQIDGHGVVARDEPDNLERAVDLLAALLGLLLLLRCGPALAHVLFLVAEAAAELLADAEQSKPQVEARVVLLANAVGRADIALLALAGRQISLEQIRGRARVPGVERLDGVVHRRRVTPEQLVRAVAAAGGQEQAEADQTPRLLRRVRRLVASSSGACGAAAARSSAASASSPAR